MQPRLSHADDYHVHVPISVLLISAIMIALLAAGLFLMAGESALKISRETLPVLSGNPPSAAFTL